MANTIHTEMMHPGISTLLEQAWACADTDFAAGLAFAEAAAQQADSLATPREQGQALAMQGHFLLRLDRAAEAQACLNRGLEISRTAGDKVTEANCLYRLGEERYEVEEYRLGLDYFLQAEPLYDAQENRVSQAKTLNSIGNVHFMVDDCNQAIHFYLQSFRLREAAGDKKGMACSMNNIGNVYAHFEDFEQSVCYYERCLAASRENALIRLEALCLSNLSESYTSLNRLSEAVAAGTAALALGHKQEDAEKQWRALLSIGRAYAKGQQHAEAICAFSEAADLIREAGSRRTECEVQIALGEAFFAAGQIAEAHRMFTSAAETASALDLKQFRSQAQAGLSKACEHQGNMAAALAHHKEFYALEKALSSEASDKRSKTLMMQMEVEKVQKEAQIHQLRNVELAALNSALEEANQTLQVQANELQAQAQELQTQAEMLEAQGEELQAQADELQRQATEDGLTGLANRRHLESWLAGRFYEARRTGKPLTVAMADVDHFKQINDRFGHQIGDEVLMSIGLLFRHACRASDLAARYGGEEFILVLPETNARQAQGACERIRQAVADYPWQTIHADLSVTISLGLSDDPAAPSHERLLGQADTHLYAAKHAGRNCVKSAC